MLFRSTAYVGDSGVIGIVMLANGIKAAVVVIDVGQLTVCRPRCRGSIAKDGALLGGACSADSGTEDKAVLYGAVIECTDKGTGLVILATGRGADGGADDDAVLYGTINCSANKCTDI